MSFEGLTPEQIFDHLDRLLYATHRNDCLALDDVEEAPGDLWRFNFLTNVSEAFDGWKAFILFHSDADEVVVLVRDDGLPAGYAFSREAFQSAVAAFDDWMHLEERRLIPELFRRRFCCLTSR